MKNGIFVRFIIVTLTILLLLAAFPISSLAEDEKYYLGQLVNAGKDTGFSETNEINEDDVHWGWQLGTFHVSGYTRVMNTSGNAPVFLKNVGDTVSLWFNLKENLDCLNGDDTLSVCADPNGYDKYFGIPETNFGRGALIIRHTDYQNKTQEPIIYTDYLSANATQGVDIKVQLFEEGDYEVALNYEIKDAAFDMFGAEMFPSYYNYRISFKFSVRNGNCMVFPFDVSTGAELTNTAITENGFRLDLAKSRYLDINIKKEILNEGAEGLIEDTRFNRPAKDGECFTDEGIYTITVKNRYTDQETIKRIYVGTNNILKAHAVTGLSVSEINNLVKNGATIDDNGKILNADISFFTNESSTTVFEETEQEDSNGNIADNTTDLKTKVELPIVPLALSLVGVMILVGVVFGLKKKNAFDNNKNESEE